MAKTDWVLLFPTKKLRIHTVPKCGYASIVAASSTSHPQYVSIYDEGDERRIQVVRHPLARLVSAWTHLAPETDFSEWVAPVLDQPYADVHTRPQIWFSGGFTPEYWQIEQLSDKWPSLGMTNLGAKNESEHKPWETYYTTELRERAEDVYSDDMELIKK